jgi:4'-phosphopantetheinyl transferase
LVSSGQNLSDARAACEDRLVRNEVHVWTARSAERPVDLLRRVLAYEVGTVAGAVRLERTCRWCGDARHGKPQASIAPPFNLAHTAGLAVVAVGPSEVGVDVERHTGPGVLEGSALALAESERADVESANDPAGAFLALWSRKEAYLKGIGRGLVEDPSVVTFRAVGRGWEAALVDGYETGWLVRGLRLPAGYHGALAVEGPPRPVRVESWPPAAGV